VCSLIFVANLVLMAALAGVHTPAAAQSPPSDRAGLPRHAPGDNASLISQRLPRVIYQGGPFLRHPRIVTITFRGDDPRLVARLEQFGDTITRSNWWRAVTDGYCAKVGDCIGEGRPGPHVRLDEELPATINAARVEALLEREVAAKRFGPLDRDELLLVYLPEGVSLADAFVPRYCAGGPRAYHSALRSSESKVPFAVLPRCGDEAELTSTASHEILEATTNSDPSARGFAFVQDSATLGFTAAGREPVDPCGLLTMDDHRTLADGFIVQRAWSNKAASQGRDPCIPSRGTRPYVALVPHQSTVRLAQEGQSITITLEAAADQPAPAWAVSAFDLTGCQDQKQYVDLSLDKSKVTAGETVNLTITVRQRSAKQLCVVGIVSTLGVHSYMWPLAVVMR
jgi:hypothetical protein